MITALAVALLSGLGAVGRVRATAALGSDARATLLVNLAGGFALGVLTGAGATGDTLLLAGTAILGSFTTFSTWMLEQDRLLRGGDPAGFARLLLVATLGGTLAVAAGWALGSLAP